jgi:hypothetical protein
MAAGAGFWATVGKAAKTMDPNNKDSGGEFKLPEQKAGSRKAPAPKKAGGGIMSKLRRGKRGLKR